METDYCTCAEPKLLVRSTRHTEEHKIQYLYCKLCNKRAGNKRILSMLAQRVAALEAEVREMKGAAK